jgi:hypothetical protein
MTLCSSVATTGWITATAKTSRCPNARARNWKASQIQCAPSFFSQGFIDSSFSYLSAEERRHHKVVIEDGLLRWAYPHPDNRSESNPLVDTTPGKWVDSDGEGLYPRPADQPIKLPEGKTKLKEDFIYVSDVDCTLSVCSWLVSTEDRYDLCRNEVQRPNATFFFPGRWSNKQRRNTGCW